MPGEVTRNAAPLLADGPIRSVDATRREGQLHSVREPTESEACEHVRVLLADDQSLFRESVSIALNSEADLKVVAEVCDGLRAVAEAHRIRPDVGLLRAELPGCDGIAATALIKRHVPKCHLVVIAEDGDVTQLVAAFEAGATGYVTKETPLTELISAVRQASRGATLVPPKMLGALVGRLIHRRHEQGMAVQRLAGLTRRERDVLKLLADGASGEVIASSLKISGQTARTHIRHVTRKLGVQSRREAMAFVVREGLIDALAADVPPKVAAPIATRG